MSTAIAQVNQHGARSHLKPVVTLVLLSPFIGEVLSGATRLSYLFAYVPEVMMWGCGTLLIREVVRRWRGTWTTMLPLALALSVAEEFVIQQTSLAPLPQLGSLPVYERAWGVNWFYFFFMLAFESVCITLAPVLITELIFPEHRDDPWLSRRGIAIAGSVFVAGAFIAWFLWVRVARIQVFHAADYRPPLITWLIGWGLMVMLVAIAYALRKPGTVQSPRKTLSPWLVLPATLLLGFPWYILLVLVFVPRPVALWIPILASVAWAVMTIAVVRRWASAPGWGHMQQWAISLGVLLVLMIAGFLGSNYWPMMDIIFKAVINVLAVAGMIVLARRVQRRAST